MTLGSSEPQLPGSQAIMRVNNGLSHNHSIFSLSVQCSINYMRSSMFDYRGGFVLDDSAHL